MMSPDSTTSRADITIPRSVDSSTPSTGVISALSVDGPVEAQFITGALTATATYVSSYADTSYINNLGDFIMNAAVTAYTSGPADMLSACVQAMCNDSEPQGISHKIYGSATKCTSPSLW